MRVSFAPLKFVHGDKRLSVTRSRSSFSKPVHNNRYVVAINAPQLIHHALFELVHGPVYLGGVK